MEDLVYDRLGRLTEVHWFDDDDGDRVKDVAEHDVANFAYTLDLLGRRTRSVEKFYTVQVGFSAVTREDVFDWVYDELGRLIGEAYDGPTGDYLTKYTFDDASNRTKLEKDTIFLSSARASFLANPNAYTGMFEETRDYFYDANDRLTSETSGTSVINYSYGVTGKRTEVTAKVHSSGRSEAYTYGADGKLTQLAVTEEGITTTYTYAYDSMGNRVKETVQVGAGAPTSKLYHVDTHNPTGYAQVLEEKPALSTALPTRVYTIGLDVIRQVDQATGSERTFVYDGHGSTRALMAANGLIVDDQRFTYDAYGNAIASPAVPGTTLLYAGEWTDKTGLQNLRSRYYASSQGRFTSRDSYAGDMSVPQSLHKYLYVHADPIQGVDPSGMSFSIGGVQVTLSISSFLTASAASYVAGKAASAAILLARHGNLQQFRWLEWTDLLSFVPGGVVLGATAKIVRLPAELLVRTPAGKIVGKYFQTAAGNGARYIGDAIKSIFPNGMTFITQSGQQLTLQAGGASSGFVHILRRHIVGLWEGSKTQVTTFWPVDTDSIKLLQYIDEAVTSLYSVVPFKENIVRLKNGIEAVVVIDAQGSIKTFYPRPGGSGVIEADKLVNLLP